MLKKQSDWVYSRWFVVFLLVSIGPFAFYNLWKSPHFSKKAKAIITSAVIIFTIAIVVGAEAAYMMLLGLYEKKIGLIQ